MEVWDGNSAGQVRSLRGGSGQDLSNSCGTGLKFAGRERTKKFKLHRTLVDTRGAITLTLLENLSSPGQVIQTLLGCESWLPPTPVAGLRSKRPPQIS